MNRRLVNALSEFLQQWQPRRTVVPATLGKGDGSTVTIDARPGYHWVRLYGDINQCVPALNRTYAAVYGLQVDVAVSTDRHGGQATYEVIGLGSNEILTNSSSGTPVPFDPYLSEHHATHEWPTVGRGRDPVNIYPRALAFGRVYPTSPASMYCLCSPIKYAHQTTLQFYAGGQTADFTSDIPASANRAVLMLVCLNGNTNTLAYVSGPEFSWTGWTDPVAPACVPSPLTGYLVLSCLMLYYGMTSITEANFRYEYRLPPPTLGGGSIMFGTEAERLAVTDKSPYTGMFWFETDTETMYMSDGTYWFQAGTWTLQPDQALATEDGQFISTEDGQGIGIEVET